MQVSHHLTSHPVAVLLVMLPSKCSVSHTTETSSYHVFKLLATRTPGFTSTKLLCSIGLQPVFDLGFYHLTDSQNLGWRRPLRSLSPNFDWSSPCQLDHGKCHIQVQDSVFTFVLHEVYVKPFLHFVSAPLNGSPTPQCINSSSQFGVIFLWICFVSLPRSLIKTLNMIKPWGMSVSNWSLAILWNIYHYFLILVVQCGFYPPHSPSIQFTLKFLKKKSAVEDCLSLVNFANGKAYII